MSRTSQVLIEDGTDDYGDPAYRPATVDELHAQWEAELTPYDAKSDYYDRECGQ